MEAERQPWRRAGTEGMPPESGPRKPPRSVREEGRSKSKGARVPAEDTSRRSRRLPGDGSQRRGEACTPPAAGRAAGSSQHTNSPFPAFHLRLPARADCTKTHTALGALAGMGWAGCGRNQRALCPTPRRACCTPGTRDSPSVQSCLLGPRVWPGDR